MCNIYLARCESQLQSISRLWKSLLCVDSTAHTHTTRTTSGKPQASVKMPNHHLLAFSNMNFLSSAIFRKQVFIRTHTSYIVCVHSSTIYSPRKAEIRKPQFKVNSPFERQNCRKYTQPKLSP